jgi:putative transposase
MEPQKQRHSTFLIQYHFVWCPRRRRKVLKGLIAKRCRELILEAASALECEVISIAIELDHVHLLDLSII